jgi:hypothetical protein
MHARFHLFLASVEEGGGEDISYDDLNVSLVKDVPVSESVQPYTQFNNGNIKVYQWTEY